MSIQYILYLWEKRVSVWNVLGVIYFSDHWNSHREQQGRAISRVRDYSDDIGICAISRLQEHWMISPSSFWDFWPSPNHPRKKWSRSRFIPSYLKPLDTLWFTWLTTKWNSENYLLPPSSAHERTTNNDIRSSYSTPLPLQSISFITSSSNSQSRTQKKLKTFPLPGTATELTRVTVAQSNPTESHQRQRAWPTHCAKSLTNVHAYLRTDGRMYVRTCEVSRQVACRYGGM